MNQLIGTEHVRRLPEGATSWACEIKEGPIPDTAIASWDCRLCVMAIGALAANSDNESGYQYDLHTRKPIGRATAARWYAMARVQHGLPPLPGKEEADR